MRVRDEVCGMEFEADEAATKRRLDGHVYYFCSQRCQRLFTLHPERYVILHAETVQAGHGQD